MTWEVGRLNPFLQREPLRIIISGVMGPLYMAENKWVLVPGVISPLSQAELFHPTWKTAVAVNFHQLETLKTSKTSCLK